MIKIRSAEFATSAVSHSQYPADGLPEIALIGRSNVGKSSLINTFINRKGLAKTSSTPGKTRLINFYRVNGEFYLVDLPGFGYAAASKKERQDWSGMIGTYLEKREHLKGALVILDPRRTPGDIEKDLFAWLDELRLPYSVVLTKADKLSRNEMSSRLAAFKRILQIEGAVVFSSHTGAGKDELSRRLSDFMSHETEL